MKLVLTAKHDLCGDIRAYDFKPAEIFPFQAGQFVMLRRDGAENKYARAFSMASAPHADQITFLMKHNADGAVSGFLAAAELGCTLEASKPVGRFILNPADTDRVFIATGTGIAPIISFLDHLTTHPDNIPHTTLFGVRAESNLFWKEKLPTSAMITLSQPSPAWSGPTGRVTQYIPHLLKEHFSAAWYICGSPDMVKDVRNQLTLAGIPAENIHFEIY